MATLTRPSFSWPQKLAVGWLALVVLTALLASVLPLPFQPGVPDLSHASEPPFGSGSHWLGTDPQGRDVLSLLIYGARTAVLLTLPAALISAIIGGLLGGAAGFCGNRARVAFPYWLLAAGGAWWGWQLPLPGLGIALAALGAVLVIAAWLRQRALPALPVPADALVLGAATTLDTIPRLVLVVAIAAGTGLSAIGLLALFTLTSWPHSARLVRAQMLRVRTLPFIEAARAAGVTEFKIWLHHALPHALQPLRMAFPLSVAGLLGLESTLSFLGIGLPPNVASWGRLMATVREAPDAWWAFLFPTILLIVTIINLTTLVKKQQKN